MLVGCYYRYDYVADLSGSSATAVEGLDQEVLQIALEWVTTQGRNCFRPSSVVWNDGAVRKMAQAIREARRFTTLPLLADALEDAGCADAEILEHCREHSPLVSDRWVVHLLLAES